MGYRGLDIHPRLLAQFLVLVEHGDLETAAAALQVRPRSLTRAVRELERAAGERLLGPADRRVSLTPAGRAVSESARDVLVAFDRFRHVAELDGDTLRVAHVANANTLATVLDDLVAAEPDLVTDEIVAPDDVQLNELRRHRLDVAVCCAPAPVAPEFRSETLRVDPLVVFDPPLAGSRPREEAIVAPRYGNGWTAHDAAVDTWERDTGRPVRRVDVPAGTGREFDVLVRHAQGRRVLVASSTVPIDAPFSRWPTSESAGAALRWQMTWHAADERPAVERILDAARATARRRGWLPAPGASAQTDGGEAASSPPRCSSTSPSCARDVIPSFGKIR